MGGRKRPRIGLLGLMLELYDRALPELKPQEEAFAVQLAAQLGTFAEVTWQGIAVTRGEVEQRLTAFREADVELIVIVHFSYAPSLIALPGLLRIETPLVLFNTQSLRGITEAFSPEEMLRNHGMHGQQDLANALRRTGRDFGVVTGHWEDPATIAELEDWAIAALALKKMRAAKIGRIGTAFQDMGDLAVDETQFVASVGPHVQQLSLAWLAEAAARAPQEALAALVAEYQQTYEVTPELTAEELLAAARSEMMLREAVAHFGLHGLAIHYEALAQDPRFEALPFAGVARLIQEGIAFGGEGDVVSAAAVLLLQELAGVATFSEMFTMDFAGGRIFMSHFAEANPCLVKRNQPIRLVRREGWVGCGGISASLAFTVEPGPMTLLNLSAGHGGAWTIIAARGEAEDFLVPGQLTPHFLFRPEAPLKDFLNRYLELGGTHHLALAPGDQLRRIRFYAQLAGLPLHIL